MIPVFLLTALVAGCSSERAESRNVKAAITRYNQLLPGCYHNLNMNPMQEVVTSEHATKLKYHMAALRKEGGRMDSQLENIEFVDVKFPKDDDAVVLTHELWNGVKGGEKQYEEKDFPYEMTYELTKKEGRWLVKSITTEMGKAPD